MEMLCEADELYQSGHHCKHALNYHLVWCPKFRFSALHEKQQAEVKMLLHEACIRYGYRLIALEVMPDHIHVFLSAGPNDTPSDIVRRLKGYTGHWLLQNDRYLRNFYSRKKALWGRGYYIASAGHVSAAAIRKYIEGQKSHHGKNWQQAEKEGRRTKEKACPEAAE